VPASVLQAIGLQLPCETSAGGIWPSGNPMTDGAESPLPPSALSFAAGKSPESGCPLHAVQIIPDPNASAMSASDRANA